MAYRLGRLDRSAGQLLIYEVGVAADLRRRGIGSEETTFEQFRIQWYHFFYTALTDQLAAEGVLRVPGTGLFHYLMIY